MATLFIRHAVADYDQWRPLFDAHEPTRRQHGLSVDGVYRGVTNRNDITVMLHADDVTRAEEFARSAELRSTMTRAGVQGTPDLWFTEHVGARIPAHSAS